MAKRSRSRSRSRDRKSRDKGKRGRWASKKQQRRLGAGERERDGLPSGSTCSLFPWQPLRKSLGLQHFFSGIAVLPGFLSLPRLSPVLGRSPRGPGLCLEEGYCYCCGRPHTHRSCGTGTREISRVTHICGILDPCPLGGAWGGRTLFCTQGYGTHHSWTHKCALSRISSAASDHPQNNNGSNSPCTHLHVTWRLATSGECPHILLVQASSPPDTNWPGAYRAPELSFSWA